MAFFKERVGMTFFTDVDLKKMALPTHAQDFFEVMGMNHMRGEFVEVEHEIHRLGSTIVRVSKPVMPKDAHIDPHWQALGERFDMDPHEVKLIIERTLQDPDESVMPAIRQLLIIGKLRNSDGIAAHRQEKSAHRRSYQERLDRYEQLEQTNAPLTAELADLKQRKQDLYHSMWNGIVDQLHACCEVAGNRMNRLSPAAHAAMVILERNSRYVVYDRRDPDDLMLVVQWEMLPLFKAPHVDTIMGFFKKVNLLPA